jgi:hypothetical protein
MMAVSDTHKLWELVMAARQCLVQAIDENERLCEEMAHNRTRMTTALERLDSVIDVPKPPPEAAC